ncbi:MAG: VWA domain-containing protein [Bryobacteraceae bacterium]|nr:VWA domain-containing protein [Bryobacteraceae bacterium]
MRTVFIVLALGAAGAALALLAQESTTFKVDVSVVNILASVRDRDGRLVNTLNREDFILEENGKRQEIRYFARQTDLPLVVGLLVDTSISQRELIKTERDAGRQFLEQVLRPDTDLAFLIKFDAEVELLQDLTNSRSLLEDALNRMDTTQRLRIRTDPAPSNWQAWPGSPRWPGGSRRPGSGTGWPGGRGGGQRRPGGTGQDPSLYASGTTLYDAVFLAADDVLRQKTGRKALILISDGVDRGSRVTEERAIEAAQRADAIVYGIRYYDNEAYGGRRGRGGRQGSEGIAALKALSTQTGGRWVEVSYKLTLEQVFSSIQDELRNQYNIGYTPVALNDGAFRQIALKASDKKLSVQARTGYYARSE